MRRAGDHRWVRVTSAPLNEPAMIVTDGDASVLVLRHGLLPDEIMGFLTGRDAIRDSPWPRLRLWRDAQVQTAGLIAAAALLIPYIINVAS